MVRQGFQQARTGGSSRPDRAAPVLGGRFIARKQFGEPVDEHTGFRTQMSIWLIGNKNGNRIRYPVAQDGFECAALNVRCGGKRQRMDDAETGQASTLPFKG